MKRPDSQTDPWGDEDRWELPQPAEDAKRGGCIVRPCSQTDPLATLPPPWEATRQQISAVASMIGQPIVYTLGRGWEPIPAEDVAGLAAASHGWNAGPTLPTQDPAGSAAVAAAVNGGER